MTTEERKVSIRDVIKDIGEQTGVNILLDRNGKNRGSVDFRLNFVVFFYIVYSKGLDRR
jgi:hypothetical protein